MSSGVLVSVGDPAISRRGSEKVKKNIAKERDWGQVGKGETHSFLRGFHPWFLTSENGGEKEEKKVKKSAGGIWKA